MNRQSETQTLIESFSTLADEVQTLIDRKTILEHKLRFAAEQYQQLADKYAPAAPEISDTLAKLQLPPDFHRLPVPPTHVPLPRRGQVGCNQHQIALLIRDGRRAAQQLSTELAANSSSSKGTSSGTGATSLSTIMEQDFTVEGKKKGMLQCPFSAMKREQQLQRQREQLEQEAAERGAANVGAAPAGAVADAGGDGHNETSQEGDDSAPDPTPHQSTDPICAAMFEDITSQPAPSSAGAVRCPIRFMDQHSPEEIAHYVETHKHELPRSHAICLRRYNKSEEQVRKLDAKYGSLVSMISGLGQFHQPMLQTAAEEADIEVPPEERAALHEASNERVKKWANGVSVVAMDEDDESHVLSSGSDSGSALERHEGGSGGGVEGPVSDNTDLERESHFDRPLKEVRLGESPSRPWGIAIPVASLPDEESNPPPSPPAAPVRMPSPVRTTLPTPQKTPATPARKCPFDHTKLGLPGGGAAPHFPPPHGPMGEDHDGENDRAPVAESVDAVHEKATATPRPPETERLFTPTKPNVAETPQLPPFAAMPREPPFVTSPKMPQVPPQMAQIPQMSQYSQTTPLQSSTLPQAPPAFLNFPGATGAIPGPCPLGGTTGGGVSPGAAPQMMFTGPVFIGYPMEQAIQFMQYFRNMQKL